MYLPGPLSREGGLHQIHCQSSTAHRAKHRSGGAQVFQKEGCSQFWSFWFATLAETLAYGRAHVSVEWNYYGFLVRLLAGLLGSLGGSLGGSFPEGGLDFLEVASVWKFPYGILPKHLEVCFGTPQTSRKSLQKRFHAEACPSLVLILCFPRDKTDLVTDFETLSAWAKRGGNPQSKSTPSSR